MTFDIDFNRNMTPDSITILNHEKYVTKSEI